MQAYDKVRRGRPEYLIEHSQKAAKLLTGQVPMDPAEIKYLRAPEWWKVARDIDMMAHVAEAKQCYQRLKVSQ